MGYVKKYHSTAKIIADDAPNTYTALKEAIDGWGLVVAQASATDDFTRKAVLESVFMLDFKFQKGGSGFKAYLENMLPHVGNIKSWARIKQFHAAYILGEFTPDSYEPPPWDSPVYNTKIQPKT